MNLVPALAGFGPARSHAGMSAAARRQSIRRGIRWNVLVPIVAVVLLTAMIAPTRAASRAVANVANPGALVNVVVRGVPGASDVEGAIRNAGGTIERRISIIDGYVARVPSSTMATLRSTAGIASVDVDQPLHLLSTTYSPSNDKYSLYNLQQQLGARGMWGKHWTGAGIDVALVDSGVTPVAGLDGAGKVIYGPDLTEESQNPATANLDTFGHGTFMAGIIAGHDAGADPVTQNGSSTAFMGFAPDARIVSVKVADAQGMTDVSQVLAGIDWVVQHADDPGMNIRVLNLSFGTDASQPYNIDPLAYAAEVAWRSGIAVVTSAGNNGVADGHLTLPAYDPFVMAVGADDTNTTSSQTDDTIPAFSSQGDGTRNPDFVMPGVHVQSLRVPGSYIDAQYGSTGVINDRYFRGSGTSEAAAVASGAAALMADEYPTATPDQIKAQLKNTALKIAKVGAAAQGSGLFNLRTASGPKTLPQSHQSFTPSTGTGSIDASRGSSKLTINGVDLSGEQDIMGSAIDTTALAAAEANGTAWNGGIWNGVRWSGDGWSGVRWSGATWTGNDWSGVRWSSDNWSNGSWDGVRWSNTTWSGATWDGVRWSGVRWSGDEWSTVGWS